MTTLPDKMLDMRQAAAFLDVKYEWLSRQVAAGRVPHTRMGRAVKFAPRHIEHIIEHGVQTAPTQPLRAVGRGRRSTL